MGFSLNNLTLFGLVLAIGIVVDDAIVVVEAVEHHIEEGMSPHDATVRAMEQVSGPVVAIGLVLAAVFVPCAFISGITGQFFRQFALTIAVSTVHLGLQLADAQPGPVRPAAQAARGGEVRGAAAAGVRADRRLAGLRAGRLPGGGRPSSSASPPWRRTTPTSRWPCRGSRRRSRRCRRAGSWPPPLNFVLGWAFRMFNRRLQVQHEPVHEVDRPAAARQRPGAAGLRRPAVSDVLRLHAHADRLHPHAGQGLSAGQRAAARLGLGGAHAAGDEGRRGNRPEAPGRQPHGRHLRPVDPAQRQRPEFRRHVPDARRLRQAHASRACRATRSPPRCRPNCRTQVPDAIVNIFPAPPVEGLGTAGGFKIIVEDRGNEGLDALQDVADQRHRQRATRRPAWKGCSPASGRRRRGCS